MKKLIYAFFIGLTIVAGCNDDEINVNNDSLSGTWYEDYSKYSDIFASEGGAYYTFSKGTIGSDYKHFLRK